MNWSTQTKSEGKAYNNWKTVNVFADYRWYHNCENPTWIYASVYSPTQTKYKWRLQIFEPPRPNINAILSGFPGLRPNNKCENPIWINAETEGREVCLFTLMKWMHQSPLKTDRFSNSITYVDFKISVVKVKRYQISTLLHLPTKT